jgi:hypothetical protein
MCEHPQSNAQDRCFRDRTVIQGNEFRSIICVLFEESSSIRALVSVNDNYLRDSRKGKKDSIQWADSVVLERFRTRVSPCAVRFGTSRSMFSFRSAAVAALQ